MLLTLSIDSTIMMKENRSNLRNNIAKSFNLEELKSICFDLNIDFNNLTGETFTGKIESLIQYLERRERIDELVDLCSTERDNIDWRLIQMNQDVTDIHSYVKLKLGDMFNGPSDLIVLPCATSGSVTNFVAKRLRQYMIPSPKYGMLLGEIDILPFSGAENIAQYVGYAVSVDNMTSNISAIQRIGKELGRFTRHKESVRAISVPLLGAGAGGLKSESVLEALTTGFKSQAASGATLTIHVLHQNVFDRLTPKKTNRIPKYGIQKEPLRVFISYSGTGEQQKEWVVQLGTFLRSNGINARLDQWHLRKDMDLPQWMTNELELAKRVIIITDSRYANRSDKRLGGIGWETMLIQGDISLSSPDSRKYLVIVREKDFSKGIPRYLRTKFSIHWAGNRDIKILGDDLLKELYDVELAPPIGVTPVAYIN